MKRWIMAFGGATVVCVVLAVCGFAGRCQTVRDSVVRLHVLANSDSDADQALKLQVRDALIEAGAGVLDGVCDREEAEQRLTAALPMLIETAEQTVRESGYAYPVSAKLTTAAFSTRVYDGATFPAGEYRTVQVTIGDGAGRNWWCVMYPPLCVSAATDKASLSDVMPQGACEIVTASSRFVVRFKIVEWIEALTARWK